MKVLVLGGTQFVGRHIVEALLAAGHGVSILTRGLSPDELPAAVERLRGDRDGGLDGLQALAGRRWDACVDVSGYTPRQVRPSAEMLCAQVGRYVFISAVMAYGDPRERPVRESQPRLPPAAEDVTEINGETYGALKVACENLVESIYAERCTLLRPQIVVGPHDPVVRYAYWAQRALQGGTMLAPGDGSDHLQVIDVHDLARFAATLIENGTGGAFNVVGPRFTWARFMQLLGVDKPVWVPAATLQSAGLTYAELPMFRPEHGRFASLMDVSNERACAAGLALTDPALTARTMQDWVRRHPQATPLPPEREAELIRLARP